MCHDKLEELLERVGRWGRFQLISYACLGFAVLFSVFPMSFIFTARDIKYRCFIPECEKSTRTTYNPKWLRNYVPMEEHLPSSCLRFTLDNKTCSDSDVLRNKTVKCEAFVYQRMERTIVQDFNIHCDENLWKLTIIGTINVLGELLGLSYTGVISDMYGRKTLLIASILLSTMVGLARSVSPNYIVYAFLEFLDTAVSGGIYGAAFILAMEMVGAKDRNIGNAIVCCVFVCGQLILGAVAWISPSWRIMLRILYSSGFVSLLFFWTVPESIRWLLSVNKVEKAKYIIRLMAKHNKKEISQTEIDSLMLERYDEEHETEQFWDSVRSKTLLLRTVHCSFTWICCTFVYYGLMLGSVAIFDDVYLSFIFVAAVEMPGYVIYYYGNERIGRRLMMFFSLVSGGISCMAAGFIPEDMFWPRLGVFLIGKCCSTIAYTVLYVFTTEMFPISSRHTLFSICSMFGRFGSMAAPQVPLLAKMSKILPLMMFGTLAVTSGCLALLFPETLNTTLPDSIHEAVHIGKSRKKRQEDIDNNDI